MGGRGSGGYRENNPMRDIRADRADPSSNSRSINLNLELMRQPPVELTADGMMGRFEWYCGRCEHYGIRPTIASMTLAFGMGKAATFDILNGRQRTWKGQRITPEVVDFLKKIYEFMEATNVDATLAAKNPAGFIFMLKNHYGYRDQREQVNVNVEARAELPDADDLARRYGELLGADVPPKELEAAVVDADGACDYEEGDADGPQSDGGGDFR